MLFVLVHLSLLFLWCPRRNPYTEYVGVVVLVDDDDVWAAEGEKEIERERCGG